MALLEIALDLTPDKDVVLLSILIRILNKYRIEDDGALTRDIDLDRLQSYYHIFSDYEVKDTECLLLVKNFYKANLIEFALEEITKVKSKAENLYHHIQGINLFSSKHYDDAFKHLNKVSSDYENFHFVASLSPNTLKKNEESQSNLTSCTEVN